MFATLLGLLLAAVASAQSYASYDAGNDITLAISIPPETAQSGSGDFFMQISGPDSNQWIAMGIGNGMYGSSIFVMYADGEGNVTVSPRLGVGNVMPQPATQAKVELLEGSGVMNGMMVANVRCTDCTTWDGSQSPIDLTSTSQSFIHANRVGAALDSTNTAYQIQQHQNNGRPFTFDLTQATGGSATANPFVSTVSTPSTGSSSGSSSSSGGSSGGPSKQLYIAHGVIMGLVVVILLPLGALIMRLGLVPWWAHGAIQVFFLLLFTAGWGIGYDLAGKLGIRFEGSGYTHTVFGTVIFAFWWIQPILGYVHHLLYKKKGKRTAVSHAHIWYGRIIFILAIVNGGLGLQLADNTTGGEIAYGVIAGVVGVLYIGVTAFAEWRRHKKVATGQKFG